MNRRFKLSSLEFASSTAGTYSVTVTGTSGSLSHSASLNVTVTHVGNDEKGSLSQFFCVVPFAGFNVPLGLTITK